MRQFSVDYDIRKFSNEFSHLKNGESDKSKTIQLAGRIYVKRSAGSKLFFYDLRSDVRLHTLDIMAWGNTDAPRARDCKSSHKQTTSARVPLASMSST